MIKKVVSNLPENNLYLIYCHTNQHNKKVYVGITKQTASSRWKNGECYKRQAFYSAIQEYGWENFEHKILADNLSREEAEYFETFFIDYFDSCENGYNVDYADGPINALCGEYYRENNIPIDSDSLITLYRTKGTLDLEILNWVDETLKEFHKQ